MVADGRDSVLTHVAWKFPGQTETVATEALGYILSRSVSSRAALRETLRTGGADIPPPERVATEVMGQQGERLDLVGFDESNTERVLIEVSSGLVLPTINQIRIYVVSPRTENQLFCFLSLRSSAWRPCEWRSFGGQLAAMVSRAGIDRDMSAQRDNLQLDALCERQDSEAFLPIREKEFAPAVPRRMLGLRRLIDDATDRARTLGVANREEPKVVSTEGLQVRPRSYGYGRYIRIGDMYYAWFGVNPELWARQKETPLWLRFYDRVAKEAQRKLGGQSYGFTLPTGVEYDAVLNSVAEELQHIAEELNS